MTDHSPSDEHLLLASAYVDGELTADERARAEADPVVMSIVEELRGVRHQLAVAAPPDEPRRDAAIAAALAAVPPIPSLAARRRARWMAPLAAAAAAVVLVVGGAVVVLQSGDDDDDGDQASLEVAGRTQLEEDAAASGAGTAPPLVAPQELATDEAEAEATEGSEATEAASAATADAGAVTAAEGQAAATTVATSLSVLVTPEDLRAFAAAPPAVVGESSATSDALCRTGDRFLGVAQVQAVDGIVDVEVYEVAAPAERVAVDRQTCEVVLRVTP